MLRDWACSAAIGTVISRMPFSYRAEMASSWAPGGKETPATEGSRTGTQSVPSPSSLRDALPKPSELVVLDVDVNVLVRIDARQFGPDDVAILLQAIFDPHGGAPRRQSAKAGHPPSNQSKSSASGWPSRFDTSFMFPPVVGMKTSGEGSARLPEPVRSTDNASRQQPGCRTAGTLGPPLGGPGRGVFRNCHRGRAGSIEQACRFLGPVALVVMCKRS